MPAVVDPIQLRNIVTVEVVENASQEETINALRQQYLKQAQAQYPGAQLLSSRLPAMVGAQM
ncbi:MAG: hypothetical protein M3R24_31290 [Chloroflexota bacterium]|nr:hypothetical protein [Chloroflexota bacterium]PLS81387.1 MAG: hypothetical protein CYG59_06005 [Chloroflexota bacterium]